LVNIGGDEDAAGGAGDSANVSHRFQPRGDGTFKSDLPCDCRHSYLTCIKERQFTLQFNINVRAMGPDNGPVYDSRCRVGYWVSEV
jgi:hypothetical protein